MKNIVLLGKGSLAIKIANFMYERGHKLYIVPDIPEPEWDYSLTEWAKYRYLPITNSGKYEDLEIDSIDLAISVFYGRIIKKDFINKCGRIINLHNSPLPKYRGVRPINWALKNNEKTHGVTIHEITEGIDDGPIIGQVIYPIYPEIEEVRDVYLKSLNYGWELFLDVFPKLDEIVAIPQHENFSYYSNKDVDKLGERSNWTR